MKASNVESGVLLYLTAEEVEHLGGFGTKVDVKMSSLNWVVKSDEKGTRSITQEKNRVSNPGAGRITCPRREDLPLFSATEWESAMMDGPKIVLKVGTMAGTAYRKVSRAVGAKPKKLVPEPVEDGAPRLPLREAIEEINRHKDKLGGHLALGIDKDGFLEAHTHYGRGE